jgi:glycosyltransferase involved in cell wall biosynthesis
MPDAGGPRRDFGALLGSVGVFGGVRRFVTLGNELARRGHRYVLYSPTGAPPDWLPYAGEVRPLAALAGAAHEVLLCGEVDLLPHFAAAPADLRLFYCVHPNLPPRRVVHDRRWALMANSGGLRRRLRRWYRVQAEDARGGIDLGLFRPRSPDPGRLGDPIRILANGRLSRPKKGTAAAVRAVEILARRLARAGAGAAPRLQLVLFDHVGPGNERDPRAELRCQVPVEYHLNESQERLAELYAGCDLFVSAEKRAGWNNTVAEAMASGLAVVCTDAGTTDFARHRDTAWVVRLKRPAALASGLHALVVSPELRMAIQARARPALLDFDWTRVADRVEAVVERHLQGVRAVPQLSGRRACTERGSGDKTAC